MKKVLSHYHQQGMTWQIGALIMAITSIYLLLHGVLNFI
jgi:hypothetical protein